MAPSSLKHNSIFAKVVRKTVFQPNETKLVHIYPDSDTLAKVLVFESNKRLNSHGFIAQRQSVTGAVDFVSISITNTLNKLQVLYPNQKIGIFFPQ